MKRRDQYRQFRKTLILGSFFIPGLGHILFGKRSRGHLSFYSAFIILLLVWRWERFLHSFQSKSIGDWLAAVFLVVSLGFCVFVSVRGTLKLLKEVVIQPAEKSPWALARRRFKENRLAVISLYVILILYVIGILAPFLALYDPSAIDDVLETRYQSPSLHHPFGTDEFGRDLYSRALFGARVSLSVGLLAVLIAISIGTVYGSVSGFFGGVVDNVMMRLVDVIIAFPTFYLLLMLVGIFEASIVAMILILGLTSWIGTARFIRGELLSLKEQQFAEAARAIGLPSRLIIFRHLIPNAISPVLVSAALMVGAMIGAEAGLSFLGIGIRPPTPTWGNMLSGGKDALFVAWWVAFIPGAILSITIISFNLLADGIRDAFDPKALMRRYI
jgi:peptide/nickel transport system permease protein